MKHILLLIILSVTLKAQEINKLIIDEKSEKPMLIGICDRSAFTDTSFSWWFNSEYNMYTLDTLTLDSISGKLNDYTITIVMGTWCSDSRREVPRFYKILDRLNYDQKKLTLICVNHEKKNPNGDIENLAIKFVPTIIFYKNNDELGRIVETPQETLEKDVLKIVVK
jgi:thiol-disulfide isomerase/thioredoxin